MDFSLSDLNFNSVENLPGFEARAAFTINSASVFRKYVDIVPTIVDDMLSYVPWGCDNQMPFDLLALVGITEEAKLKKLRSNQISHPGRGEIL